MGNTIESRTRHTLPPDLAAALRLARVVVGLRLAARRAGVSPGYLCRLEHGERCPSVDVAHALIEALRLEADGRSARRRAVLGATRTDESVKQPGA